MAAKPQEELLILQKVARNNKVHCKCIYFSKTCSSIFLEQIYLLILTSMKKPCRMCCFTCVVLYVRYDPMTMTQHKIQ